MTEYIQFLWWPFVAAIVLVGIHVYFGLHVIKRGIIFIDLSLAQVAALGVTIAILVGFQPDGMAAYVSALGLALIGGVIFTFTRGMGGRVPQEAIIGIVYAVSSAAAVLAVSHSPEGSEHIRHLLVGSLLTVAPAEVGKTAAAYAVVGLFHWLARRRFLALSFGVNGERSGDRWWDLLFYASFAIVVTSSVKICGVLLVFVFLVVPSVFAAVVTESIGRRLAYGWLFGLVGSVLGLAMSVVLDTPSGATIVVTLGLMLLLFGLGRAVLRK